MRLDDDSASDLFSLICGYELGCGATRTVYQHALSPQSVVKHEIGNQWCNINEYQIWFEFRNTELAKWLAPVEWISPRGMWLIQAKTEPIPDGRLPEKVPAIFCDIKRSNWGMYKGRPVCHDYGYHRGFTLASKGARAMKSAKWDV